MRTVLVLAVSLTFILPGCSQDEEDDRDLSDGGPSGGTGGVSNDSGNPGGSGGVPGDSATAGKNDSDGAGGISGSGSGGTSSNEETLDSLAQKIRETAQLTTCASDDECIQVSYGCSFIVYHPEVTDEEELQALIAEYEARYWEGREDRLCPPSGVWNYRCVENECTDVGSNW